VTNEKKTRASARGFTLIEVMMVVAIIGVVSSVAIPEYQNMTMRSKLAERENIMVAVVKGVEDITLNSSTVPTNSGSFFVGAWNPDANPTTMRRPWVQSAQGWNMMPVIIEGSTFCSYSFTLNTAVTPMVLQVVGACDIDGDGVQNIEVETYQGIGNSFLQMPPPFGQVITNPQSF